MTDKTPKPSVAEHGETSDIERRVLDLVGKLASELSPGRAGQVTPRTSLQRELGIDSLGLAELLLRAEREFKVRLPDDLITRLETPQTLIDSIGESDAAAIGIATSSSAQLSKTLTTSVPEEEATLSEVLEWHVRHHGDRPHVLLSDGYSENATMTYRALADAAGKVAAGLQAHGLEVGERVCIMLPTGRSFFEAFFGALLAGAVPVPIYPPMRLTQLEEHLRRQAGILKNSRAAFLIVPREGHGISTLLGAQIDTLRGVHCVEDLRLTGNEAVFVTRHADDLAMLQYTSGSTGRPKGVMLSHANLLSNIRAMGTAIAATPTDVFVSWLPLYHDLGLIGAWLGSLYHAVPTVIMSPLRFIVRPESWLWAIHRNAATLSAAPNFAYELCVNKIEDHAIEGLDLSTLRVVANGAEPVSAETIRRFSERFVKYGFRPEAMTPVYGLAENSVGLAFSALGEEPVIERVSRQSLSRDGIALPTTTEKYPIIFASSGVALPDHEIRVVDDLERELPERHQGRLEFRGPSSTSGYFDDPERTAALIRNGWLDSGDLAYSANGRIFITGRVKDIIIKGGRNIYPEEIEQAVGNLPRIRKGCVAAFASVDELSGTESLIVVAETRETDSRIRAQLDRTVNETISDVLGMPPDHVVIVPPQAVPKTSSGKIRRTATRDLYLSGRLGQPAEALWLQVVRLGLASGVPRLRRALSVVGSMLYACRWWCVVVCMAVFTWTGVLALPGLRLRWWFVRKMAHGALRLMGIPLTVKDGKNLARSAGVVAVNHSSYLDVVVLAAILPDAPVFVAKGELQRQWIAGPFLRNLNAVFTERADAESGIEDVRAFQQLVRQGEMLVIFPEATFLRMPGMLPFRLGAFKIATATHRPLLPVVLRGTRSILRGGQWFPRPGAVGVHVLEPFEPEGEGFADAVRLRDQVRSAMLECSGEPNMADRHVKFPPDAARPAAG